MKRASGGNPKALALARAKVREKQEKKAATGRGRRKDGEPIDGDRDGRVYDGTARERPAPPRASEGAKGGKAGHKFASRAELAAARAQAQAKIAAAPVPPPDKVAKMRAALELAKADPSKRAGGDARGSAADRRRRAEKMFEEFGGRERGYVVCHETGIKMHWSDDPKINPRGYPKFEQGKIFTARQGGGYQMPNLLPESFEANRSRNDKPVRPENLD